jgi:HEPN domain-containing protein
MNDKPNNVNAEFIASYLRLAKGDLDEARLLFDSMPGSRGSAFHLEQAAEKIIRAITTSEDIRVGVGHELDNFVRQIPDTNPLKHRCTAVQELKRYATSYRYPTSKGKRVKIPSKPEFDDQYIKVQQLLNDAAARFEVDLDQENLPAGKPDPIR